AAWRLPRLGVERLHAHFANQTADCAGIAGSVAGLPFSFTAHAYDIYSTDPRVRNATLDWKLRHAARVFTVSNFARDLLRAQLPEADRERVCTAYVGIPTGLFRAEPPPPDRDGVRLLCVARFQEKKGIDTLLDACALLRDRRVPFHLELIGEGPLRTELEAQVARLDPGRRVTLPGRRSQEEVAEAMKACHLVVMPCRRDSTGDMDGIPTVFMEALATGRPVVSCALSGVPELVRDGETGALVPPDDARALADAVERLAAAPPAPARRCAAGVGGGAGGAGGGSGRAPTRPGSQRPARGGAACGRAPRRGRAGPQPPRASRLKSGSTRPIGEARGEAGWPRPSPSNVRGWARCS